jgi:hypothetical protein
MRDMYDGELGGEFNECVSALNWWGGSHRCSRLARNLTVNAQTAGNMLRLV